MRFVLVWIIGCGALLAPRASALPTDGVLAERRAALEQGLMRLDGEEGRIAERIAARTRAVSEREVELARLEAELAQEEVGTNQDEVAIATLKTQWEAQRDGIAAELEGQRRAGATPPAELEGRLASLDALLASGAPAREIVALQRRLEGRRSTLAALRARLLAERYEREQAAATRVRMDEEAKGAARRIAALEVEQEGVEARRTSLEEEIQRAESESAAERAELLRAQADLAALEGYRVAEEIAAARAHYTTARFTFALQARQRATDPRAAPLRVLTRRLVEERAQVANLDRQLTDLGRRRRLYEGRKAALIRQAEILSSLEEEGLGQVSVEQRQATVVATLEIVAEHERQLTASRAAEAAFIGELEAALTGRADVRLRYRAPRAWSLARLPETAAELATVPRRLGAMTLPAGERVASAVGALVLGLLFAGVAHRLRFATRRTRARRRRRTHGYRGVRAVVALIGVAIGLASPTFAAIGLGIALYLTLPSPVEIALLALLAALWASAATRIGFGYLRWLLRGGRIFSVPAGSRRGWHWLARFGDLVWFYLAIGYGLVAVDAPPASIALLNDGATATALVLLPILWSRRPPVLRPPGLARRGFFLLVSATAALLLLALAGYHNLAMAIGLGGAVTLGLVVLWGVGTLIAADLWHLAVAPGGRLARLASLQGEEAARLARTLTRATSLLIALALLVWKDPTQALFASPLWRLLANTLHHPLAHLRGVEITTLSIIQGAVIFAAFLFTSRLLRRLLRDRLYPRTRLDAGARNAINSFINYGLLTLGVLVALQAVGIDLTTLTVFAGAFGVGLGFGLQNIANNFVSGLILLLERPVKTGDYIDIGTTSGVVQRIGARSTQIRTRDNIAIVVPNSELISQSLINWSLEDPKTRIHVTVGVAYGSDPRQVEKILIGVAKRHPTILDTPPPRVWFQDFGDSSLDFVLLVWVRDPAATPLQGLRSELRFAIFTALTEASIEIPFPQRDLHIRSWSPPPWPGGPGGEAEGTVN